MSNKAPLPQNIVVHQQSKVLELVYGTDVYKLPFEFLRVWSPSAEVRGHGVGQRAAICIVDTDRRCARRDRARRA